MDKEIIWIGSSYKDLLDFPSEALKDAGKSLRKIQNDLDPDDWKPFATIGAGANEIRTTDKNKQLRVFYVAKFAEALYVLHCFPKTTEKTSKHDVAIGKDRYKGMVKRRKENAKKKH